MLSELLTNTVRMLSGTANPDQWLIDWFNGGQASASGEYITEENALNCTAMKCAVGILAETMSCVPIEVYKLEKSGRRTLMPDHPIEQLLTRAPNPETSDCVWKEKLQIDLGIYGNAYSWIQRTIGGKSVALWQRSPKPERTSPFRNPKDGRIWYRVRNEAGGEEDPVPAADMLHIPYFSMDGIVGKSPVRMLREAIGGNKGAERLANELFANHGAPQGFFKFPGKVSQSAYGRLKASIAEQSEHGQRHKTQILEEGGDWIAASFDPQKTQMIEARRFLIEEIARAYRISLHLMQVMLNGTVGSITELGRQFITYTMMAWFRRWASEINLKLLTPPYYCRFNPREFLKGDYIQMATFLRTMFSVGGFSVNDILHEAGYNTLDEPKADEHFVPLNMVPLSKAGDQPPPENGDKTPKPGGVHPGDGILPAEPNPAKEAENQNHQAAAESARAVVADVLHRMDRIESNETLRAAKDPAKFIGRLDAFYEKHVETMREALAGPIRTLTLLSDGPYSGGVVADAELSRTINDHIGGKREALLMASECKPAELYARVEAIVKEWGAGVNASVKFRES